MASTSLGQPPSWASDDDDVSDIPTISLDLNLSSDDSVEHPSEHLNSRPPQQHKYNTTEAAHVSLAEGPGHAPKTPLKYFFANYPQASNSNLAQNPIDLQSTSCHCCKTVSATLTACSRKGCGKQYCLRCLSRSTGTPTGANWLCLACQGTCPCSTCAIEADGHLPYSEEFTTDHHSQGPQAAPTPVERQRDSRALPRRSDPEHQSQHHQHEAITDQDVWRRPQTQLLVHKDPLRPQPSSIAPPGRTSERAVPLRAFFDAVAEQPSNAPAPALPRPVLGDSNVTQTGFAQCQPRRPAEADDVATVLQARKTYWDKVARIASRLETSSDHLEPVYREIARKIRLLVQFHRDVNHTDTAVRVAEAGLLLEIDNLSQKLSHIEASCADYLEFASGDINASGQAELAECVLDLINDEEV